MEELQDAGTILQKALRRSYLHLDSGEGNSIPYKNRYSTEEVIAFGMRFDKEPPEPRPCEYCGKLLYFEGLFHNRRIISWLPIPQHCDCVDAIRHREEKQAAEAEEKRQAEIERERQRKQARIDRLIGQSGIQRRFLNRTFEQFVVTTENNAAFNTARVYYENFDEHYKNGDGLYFEGTYGTGKTHLAAAIALALMQRGTPCIFRTSIDLLGDIKKTFQEGFSESENDVLKVYREADLLVIDDLGKEVCSDWSNAMLYSILNARYEDLRPTIITTNYNDEALISRLTPKHSDSTNMRALMSRLKECCTVVTMTGRDWRTGA